MSTEVVILAAGQGTRMRSRLPKVLHTLAGRPLLQHVVEAAAKLEPSAIRVVVGYRADAVREAFADGRCAAGRDLCWVEQPEPRGTGDAVLRALPEVDPRSTVLVLYGDVPLVRSETLAEVVAAAAEGVALVTAEPAEADGLGRIVRDQTGSITAVVEERDATNAERAIGEINSGILAAPAALLHELLDAVDDCNTQNEIYLTDVIGLAAGRQIKVTGVAAREEMDVYGVNDRRQLAQVEREYQRRVADALMLSGSTLADPERIDVRGTLKTGIDCSIDVNTVFEGDVVLGDEVRIGPNCVVKDALIGNGCVIEAHTVMDGAVLEAGCRVGPFARLRPDTVLEAGVKIGNFVEAKKTHLGRGTKSNHFAYLGDTTTGPGCNIGAGTIMCNYDGANKHPTRLGAEVFVGSNATLVAPLEIADGSYVAAGSTVTMGVAAGELAVGRARQRNIQGWTPPTRRNPTPPTRRTPAKESDDGAS